MFDVKCTDKLIVHPSSGVINIWIDPVSNSGGTVLELNHR